MTAGVLTVPDKAKLNLYLGLLNQTTYKLALVASSWTPDNATLEVLADVSGELSTGGGYTSGGASLASVTLAQTGGVVKFTSSPVQWTATGGGITAWRYAVLYYLGTLASKVNPIVGYLLGDSAPADVPLTASGNTLTVTPNSLGWVSS